VASRRITLAAMFGRIKIQLRQSVLAREADVMGRLYPILRAVQSYVPFTRRAKFELYIHLTRYFGFKIDDDFRLLSHLDKVELAIDIGGNWGQSIEALRWTCKPQRIVCVEPNPYLSGILRSRYKAQPEITILEKAISDAPGEQELFVPHYRGFVYDGLASLDRMSASEWLNKDSVVGFDQTKLRIERHKVEMITLDSLSLRPNIVKIDVQGYELQVLKGGAETFTRWHPITIIETPNDAVVSLLADYGLLPFKYRENRLRKGDTSGLNTVFLGSRDQERFKAFVDGL
jgi:FkbM family methyltransferase